MAATGNNPRIIISIDLATGNLTSTVEGVKGAQCSVLNKWVDEIGEVTADIHTDEYHEVPDTLNVIKNAQNTGGNW